MVLAIATARGESLAQLCATKLRLNLFLVANCFAAEEI
jgi:hypothetical protein